MFYITDLMKSVIGLVIVFIAIKILKKKSEKK